MERRSIKETDLVVKVQQLAPGAENDALRAKLSQQMINYIKNGGERSFYIPFLATALDVPCLWLAFGIGPNPSWDSVTAPMPDAKNERERLLLRCFRSANAVVKQTIEKALESPYREERIAPKKNLRISVKKAS